MNAIISFIDTDTAQLRDMGMYTYFIFIRRSQSFAESRIKKERNNGIHLPVATCRPSQQKHICIYSILILYAGYTMNSSRLTHVIYAYLKCYSSLVLFSTPAKTTQMPSAFPNTSSDCLLDRRLAMYSSELNAFNCTPLWNFSCKRRAPAISSL